MYKYLISWAIECGIYLCDCSVVIDNREDAVNFHDSINMLYPNAATIDSLIIKTKN